ncbi:MAG: dihydrofolate reductase family protein [Gemmatimonadota bacterium]
MRSVRYSVAMSLDGYIGAPDGTYDWIVMDPAIDFAGLFASFDTFLIGRRTYEVMQGMGPGPGMKGVTSIVFSRTLRQADHPGVTIVSGNAAAVVAELKAQPGKDIWLFGGGELFRSLLEAKQVDAVEVGVMPVLLGGGVPLLPGPAPRARLELVKSNVLPSGIVSLTYRVNYAPSSKRRASARRKDSTNAGIEAGHA